MRGGIFVKRQPHQRHPIGRYALRDRAIDQFQLLLVQSQFDDRLGHGLSLKLYTRSGSEIVFSDAPPRRPVPTHPADALRASPAVRRLFPVLKASRSAKFRRCAAESSSVSNKIPASCVPNSELSYAPRRKIERAEGLQEPARNLQEA
jgi:hypothetical protein